MLASRQGELLSVAGLSFASGAGGGLYAKGTGTGAIVIAIIVGLALALVGLIYSRRSEKKERAEAWEQEVRIKKKIEAAGMSKEVRDKALQELKKLEAMPPMSAARL